MKKVILINGFKRIGKDTVAGLLKKELERKNYRVELMSMATPLKKCVCTQLEISFAELEKWKNSEEGIWRENDSEPISNFRRLLQKTGDAIKEINGDEIFGVLLGKAVSKSNADFVIVPDFRYQIELDGMLSTPTIKPFQIYTIRVEGDRIETPPRTHASEFDLIDRGFQFDVMIRNNKTDTFKTLIEQCECFVNNYMEA